jgi:hypothetical protein
VYRIKLLPTAEEIADGYPSQPCYMLLLRCLNFDPAQSPIYCNHLQLCGSVIEWVYDTHDEPTEFSFPETIIILQWLEENDIDATYEEVREYELCEH